MTPDDIIQLLEVGMCHRDKREECAVCTRRLRAIEGVRRMEAAVEAAKQRGACGALYGEGAAKVCVRPAGHIDHVHEDVHAAEESRARYWSRSIELEGRVAVLEAEVERLRGLARGGAS